MQKSLISPETFFSDEPLFALDGILNTEGLRQNNIQLEKEYEWLDTLFTSRNNSSGNSSAEIIIPQFSLALDFNASEGPPGGLAP